MLKFMRLASGQKQSELGNKINIAQTTVSGYETGYSNPDFATIERIANECDFEIIFRNKKTQEEFTAKSIERKDI